MLHFKKVALLMSLSISPFLSGCAPFTSIHGNLPEEETVASIKVGEQTQEQVVEILGPPTTIAPFDPKVWYYVGEKVERLAFFNPDVIEKEVFMIKFNDNGIVESLTPIEEPHDFGIIPGERKTKTLGRSPSLLKEMFGNFGKFSRSSTPKN